MCPAQAPLDRGSAFCWNDRGRRCAMSWTRERDLLIAQTMTFVQSITGKKPEARTETRIEFAPVDQIENATRPIEMRSYERSCLRRGRRRRPGPNFARKS